MKSLRSDPPLTRTDRIAIWGGLSSLLAGVVLLLLASGFVATIIGACLLGLGGIAFVSLLFLLVGESEDRDYRR